MDEYPYCPENAFKVMICSDIMINSACIDAQQKETVGQEKF